MDIILLLLWSSALLPLFLFSFSFCNHHHHYHCHGHYTTVLIITINPLYWPRLLPRPLQETSWWRTRCWSGCRRTGSSIRNWTSSCTPLEPSPSRSSCTLSSSFSASRPHTRRPRDHVCPARSIWMKFKSFFFSFFRFAYDRYCCLFIYFLKISKHIRLLRLRRLCSIAVGDGGQERLTMDVK